MAIGSAPIDLRTEVWNEFGSNTRPANAELGTMHDLIFGSGTKDLTDFANTGQPTGVSTGGATNIDTNSADLGGSISSVGGLTCTYYFQYDTNSSFTSPSTSTTGTVSTSPGSVTPITISGLSDNTTYYFRIILYNAYISNSADRIVGGTNNFTTDAACTAPGNFTAAEQPFGDVQLDWTYSATDPANGFEIQYRVNLGNWNVLVDNTAGSARQYLHNGCNSDYNNGDSVGYRIKAQCLGGDSVWVGSQSDPNIQNCK